MSQLDPIIRSDLAALGAETRDALPEFASFRAAFTGASDPYRDDKPGAEARRRSLFEARLRELAMLPLAHERVFVHRVSRAAAGAVALLAVAVATLASIDVWTARLVQMVFGVPTPELTAALLLGSALAAYVFAGLIAERVYERRMRRQVGSTGDAFADIDGLEGSVPLEEARRLIDRVDAAAIALPLSGLVASALLLGLLLFFSDLGFTTLGLINAGSGILIAATFAAVIAGVVLGLACVQDRRGLDGSPIVRLAEHWTTLVVGGICLIGSLWYAARAAFGLHAYGLIPDNGTTLTLGVVGLAAAVLPSARLLLWLRRQEHARLGDSSPRK